MAVSKNKKGGKVEAKACKKCNQPFTIYELHRMAEPTYNGMVNQCNCGHFDPAGNKLSFLG